MQKIRKALKRHPHAILLPCIWLITLIAFYPTFFNGFQMEWDDQWMVMNRQTVLRLRTSSIWAIFTEPSHGQIGPLNQLMYTLLYRAFGFNPLAFHSASLALHLCNSALLYRGLLMIVHDCISISRTQARWIVAITTVLFAIHPLQVETVAWVSASKILLFTTFYLAGAIMLIKYLRKGNIGWYAGALLMQLTAYLSKEQAVVFPLFAMLLYHWYGIRYNKRKFWTEMIPFCLLALASVCHEVFYVANYDNYIQGHTYEWWQRGVFCIYSIVTYLFKWIVPVNLNWMYFFPIGIEDGLTWWLLLYPVLAACLIYATWDKIKKTLVASSLAFIFIHLLLVVHILVLPRTSVVADRYMYLPIVGCNFLLSIFIVKALTWCKYKKAAAVLVGGYIIALTYTTNLRTHDWKNSKTLREVPEKQQDITHE